MRYHQMFIFLIVLSLSPSFIPFTHAEEEKRLLGDRFSVDIGYKAWIAKWSTVNGTLLISDGNEEVGLGPSQEALSNYFLMHGPTVTVGAKIREHDWFHSTFVNFTWLQGNPNFLAGDTDTFDSETNLTLSFSPSDEAKRRDYSIVAGLGIYKGLGVYAGYYNQKGKFKGGSAKLTDEGEPLANFKFKETEIFRGPLLGLYANVPLINPVGFYSNFTAALLRAKFEGTSKTGAAQGLSAEMGLAIKGPQWPYVRTAFQVGFRGQFITAKLPKDISRPGDRKFSSNTWGPIFSLLVRF